MGRRDQVSFRVAPRPARPTRTLDTIVEIVGRNVECDPDELRVLIHGAAATRHSALDRWRRSVRP